MRIAFFHELPDGGAKIAVHEIAKALKSSHTIDLFYVDSQKEKGIDELYHNVKFFSFTPKVWSGKNWRVRLYKDTIELLSLRILHKKIADAIDKENYDFVFINASKYIEAPYILRFLKTKKIFYCHDPHYRFLYESILSMSKDISFGKYYYEKVNRFIRKNIDRKNFFAIDCIVANSRYAQRMIKQSYDRDSKVAYLGVDETFFLPKKIKKEIDILYVGSYDPVDGYELLVRATKYFRRKLVIKAIMKETEWIDRQELVDLYNRSRIVVCLGVNEPFGLVPLEAMACSIPVIAVAEGGYTETVIDQRTGILIPRDDKILYEAIKTLLDNTNLQKTMGVEGRKEIMNNWTWNENVNKLLTVIKSCLKNR